MLTFDDARQKLISEVNPLPPISLPLGEADGLYLSEEVRSDIDLPHWDVSAMDGYAVRAEDLTDGRALPCDFVTGAGDIPGVLDLGTTSRIFTGAVIPEGADTVVKQELAEVMPDGSVTLQPLPLGSNVRLRGEVLRKGSVIAGVGDLLTPYRIGVLASGGVDQVLVTPRSRVAIIMTGSELVDSNQQPTPGYIRNSNGPMLKALIRRSGLELSSYTVVADDLNVLSGAIENAAETADIIVSSGGVSVGDRDFVPEAVIAAGGKILFHKVAMKPGKPILTAKIGNVWFMGLPGNPVSVLTGWRMFVESVCGLSAGDESVRTEQPLRAVVASTVTNPGSRMLLHPATVDYSGGVAQLVPYESKGSHDIMTFSKTDALMRIESGQTIEKGELISYFEV